MKIGIVGFGNLGRSLASGLIKSGCAGVGDMYVCEVDHDAQDTAHGEPYHAFVSSDINDIIIYSDIVFLTVKGYVFESLSSNIDKSVLEDKIIVSFMAGVPFEKIYSMIGDVTLVRAMPSLAIASCDGVIGYTAAPDMAVEIFRKLGYAFETEPADIEKVMAFSSCGLGFAAYLIDAFASAGTAMGFSPEVSAHIAALTFKNAVDRGGFRETVRAVATKGGATEQGVLHMNECSVYDIISKAVRKAYERMI